MLKKLKSEFTQAKYLLSFLTLQTVGQAVTMAVPMVIAGLFSKELYGRYSISETLIFFFVTLFLTSSRTAVIVYANQERAETGLIGKTFSVQFAFLMAGVIAFVIIFIVFQRYLRMFAGVTLEELILLGLAFLGWTIKDFIVTIFFALNKRLQSALAEIAFGCIALSALTVFYLFDVISLKSVFISYFIASIGAVVIGLKFIDIKLLCPFGIDREHFRQIFTFSMWTLFGVMSAYLINWGGLAVMRKFTSFAETGTYNLAFKFFKGFMALTYIIPAYFLPHISETIGNIESIKSYLYHKRPRILLLGAAGLAVAYFATPFVLRLFYKEKFVDCTPAIRILLIGAAAFLYSSFFATLFTASKEYKFIQAAGVSQVVVNMILNFALIPSIGMYGAAIATSASFIYLAIISELFFRWKLQKKLLAAG
ncbi:MAG: polysaccharide biosynthesis C-terminal domain-containing protein [Phycisphaerae bacterium]|jgi:O-antigen/teichoic acid export membrane protein